MSEEAVNKRHTVMESESKEKRDQQIQFATDFLLRSRHNGIFYRNGTLAYMIPIQYTLGYKVAPLRPN